jgi:hypothetical protein
LYETVFSNVLQRCQSEAKVLKRKFRFKHKLLSLDSTVIPLCLSVFDWACYKRAKGALMLHMVLDHDGYLPSYAVVTDGKTADITAAKRMTFAPVKMAGALAEFYRECSVSYRRHRVTSGCAVIQRHIRFVIE